MKKRTTAMLVAMTLLSWCTAVSAQPGGLYRGSVRPPSVVFEQGFVGGGANANPIDHASGASCIDPASPPPARSAYVALTERMEDAQLRGLYVYVVTPDQNAPDETATFNLVDGLRHVATHSVFGLNLRQRSAVENPGVLDAVQGQHVSRRIPREWIYSVSEFTWNVATGAPELVRVELNPHYRQPVRIGSRQRFSDAMIAAIQLAPPPPQATFAMRANGTAASVCLVESCASSPRSRAALQSSGPAPMHCVRESMHAPASRWLQAVDVVLGN